MISVIIPAYNADKTIADCLEGLQNQTMPASEYEIIVVDDGSIDQTRQIVAQTPHIRLIEQERGMVAAARNAGIQAAQGEIICFTDADCVPQKDWLEQISAPLRENPNIIGSKGRYNTQQSQFTARFVQIEYEDKYDRMAGYRRISFIDTYSAAFRRQVLLDIGCFNERFQSSEDRELSYRLAAAGHEMVFQPTAVVYHSHADSPGAFFIKKLKNGYWGGQAISHFPKLGREDQYTPHTLKMQVVLMGLVLPALVGGFLFQPLWWGAAAILFAFLLTTIPFVRKCWRKDKAVALLSPIFLGLRALALGLGFVWRLIRPIPPFSEN